MGLPRPVILLVPIAIAPLIVPPARASLVAIEFVTVVEKLASLPKAVANSFNVSSVAGADATKLLIEVSTYPLVAASPELVGLVRLVMVAAVPAFMFNPPLIVTSLKEDVPVDAVTFPVKLPVTFPVTLPVKLPVTLPVTAPVRPPTKPTVAVTVVPVTACAEDPPITAPSIVPALISAEAIVAAVLTVRLVTVAAAAVEAPITTLSNVPPLMSALVTVMPANIKVPAA